MKDSTFSDVRSADQQNSARRISAAEVAEILGAANAELIQRDINVELGAVRDKTAAWLALAGVGGMAVGYVVADALGSPGGAPFLAAVLGAALAASAAAFVRRLTRQRQKARDLVYHATESHWAAGDALAEDLLDP